MTSFNPEGWIGRRDRCEAVPPESTSMGMRSPGDAASRIRDRASVAAVSYARRCALF